MDYRIFSVHGTFAADRSRRGPRWWQRESPFSDRVLSYLDTDTFRITWEPFQWSGDNATSARGAAAARLAQAISLIDHQTTRVAVVAHSHGGNVAHSALATLEREHQVSPLPLVTVGTPFIHEVHGANFELSLFGWLSCLALCVVGLWFSTPGSAASVVLVAGGAIAIIACAIAAYLKVFTTVMPTMYRVSLRFHSLFIDVQKTNTEIRSRNSRSPKIYSLFDEAINGLRAVPVQAFSLATRDVVLLPTACVASAVVLVLGVMATYASLPLANGGVAVHVATLIDGLDASPATWMDNTARLVVLLVLSTLVGYAASLWFLARWTAYAINKVFAATIRARAYGRDSGLTRVLPMVASPNLPLIAGRYDAADMWKPIPKCLDDDFDRITAGHAIGMFRTIKDCLSVGLTTGSYTMSESISTSFSGDELVHSAYFSHPDMPGFLAWILCEFYGFPKGARYSTLPVEKFQQWWDAIRPDSWSPSSP